jgi:trehalose 6-phosphate synthase
MARQIANALVMSLEERRERWSSMVAKLRQSSVQNWFSDFLQALAEVGRKPARLAASRPPSTPMLVDLAGAGRTAHGY